jgi:hypothetical protein
MNPPNNSQKNWLSFLDTKKRHPDLQGCMPRFSFDKLTIMESLIIKT